MGCGGSKGKDNGKAGVTVGKKTAGNKEYALFKILLIGDSGVGKSSLLLRFTDAIFPETFISTIGADFKEKFLEVEGSKCKLQLWDTAGQEKFRTITGSFYRNTSAVMVVFDICSRESFANVPKWFTELERYAGENVARMIVGNKSDRAAERTVTEAEAKELADRMGLPYIECSAKTDAGVTESFTKLAKLAKDQAEADEMDD